MRYFKDNDISKVDIEELISSNIVENGDIEYKDTYDNNGNKDPQIWDKIIPEIVAFANGSGGDIVVGLKEENGIPIKITDITTDMSECDEIITKISNKIRSQIRPTIFGLTYTPVEITNNQIILIIGINQSPNRPHSHWDGNKDNFYIRHGSSKYPMLIEDLRKQFNRQLLIKNEIIFFLQNRLSMISNNESVGILDSRAKFVLHIIPECSFDNIIIDIRKVKFEEKFTTISGFSGRKEYNIDGCYSAYSSHGNDFITSYILLFSNGIIEIYDSHMMNYGESQTYSWVAVQNAIVDKVKEVSSILEDFELIKPWHLYATILDAKGYVTTANWGSSKELDRNEINSLSGYWGIDDSIDDALYPMLTSLSNAFGYEQSSIIDENNKIKQDK